MWKTTEGSTGRLLQLCVGYFVFYVITGVTVKYFQGPAAGGFPGMLDVEFTTYSTIGGTAICLGVVFALHWFHLQSIRRIDVLGMSVPSELLYIIPSGICTAVIIPTTTLMYSLEGISVMVAMVIMRGSVIVISRLVDEAQIRQGILVKKLYREENIAAVFAIAAVSVILFWDTKIGFSFKSAGDALIFISYISAYAIRIYIMNYFKNTRPKGAKLDNNGFFAVEQMSASAAMLIGGLLIYFSPELFGAQSKSILLFRNALEEPKPMWGLAILAGTAFGIVAFFSVFIFMFKGRTATFAGLVNRLTSLIAGTTATLACWVAFAMPFPGTKEWASLGLILIAVGFLTISEKKRAAELAAAREIIPTEQGENVGNFENSPAARASRIR